MKDRAFEDQYLERELNGQLVRLYMVKHVPLDTKFAPKTKNEIKVRRKFLTNIKFVLSLSRKCVGFQSLIYQLIAVMSHHKLN